MKRLLIKLFLVVWGVVNFACPDMSSSYGLFIVESPSGERLYFRREARGLNYDALSLSANPDYCSEPNAENDFIFVGLGPTHLFYKFEDDELHLYLVNVAKTPDKFSGKTKVIQHQLNNLEFLAMKENYKSKGLALLDISINDTLKCK